MELRTRCLKHQFVLGEQFKHRKGCSKSLQQSLQQGVGNSLVTGEHEALLFIEHIVIMFSGCCCELN